MDFSKYGLQPEQIIELENTYKQEIEKIKMVFNNLMEDECYNFNRIF